jgi:hypothetical protein
MSKKLPAKTYKDIDIDFDYLRNKLKLKSIQEKLKFHEKFPEHSAKILATTALTSALLLNPVTGKNFPAHAPTQASNISLKVSQVSTQEILLQEIKTILPEKTKPLTLEQEKKLSTVFSSAMGIKAVGTLEGEHLNTTYGLIGAEQHLRRYPGDVNSNHGTGTILKEGMAPGLGAWGYFAPSRDKLTPDLIEGEKWYVVVQTLYLPDWSKRLAYLRDWYKYRKVLVVNTLNGNAVVGDIADSGPAKWTGKSFGGGPEVMEYLGGPRYKVGPVLLFFLDDPENKIPLGPVGYNKTYE